MQTNKQMDQENENEDYTNEMNESEKQEYQNAVKESESQKLDPLKLTEDQNARKPDFDFVRQILEEDLRDKSKGWRVVADDKQKNIIVSTKQTDFSNVLLISIKITWTDCNYDIFKMWRMLMVPDLRLKWDNRFKEMQVIETIDNNSDIVYVATSGIFLFKDRDFCNYRYQIHNKTNPELMKKFGLKDSNANKIFVVMKSIEHPKIPIRKGLIRAHTYCLAICLSEDENNPKNITLQLINHTDIRGSVPKFFLNFMFPRVAKKFEKSFKDAYKKIYPDS